MTKSSDTEEPDDVDNEDYIKRFFEFGNDEPIVHVTREITITREMLDTERVWAIVEPVVCKMYGVETGAQAETILAAFSLGQRRLYAIQLYLMEVQHGGHSYFFRYSGGLVWPDALAGLEMIGATAAYETVLEATRRFPEPPSVEFAPRNEALEKLSCTLGDLDSRIYDVDVEVDELMHAYIRAHPEEFLCSVTVDEVQHPCKMVFVDGQWKWVPKEQV